MNIEYKTYTKRDKSDVLKMMTSFNEIYDYDFDPKIGEKNLIDFTSNEILGRLYLIKYQQSNIGYIVLSFGFSFEYEGRDAFIDEFYIKENYRNQGVGKLTMDFIELESKKLNVNAIHLEVESHNSKANKLYMSKGYKSNNRILLTKKIKTTANNSYKNK
ncbi:N-acetyltransferase [Aquimarina sp. Aq107]|uniref:GNAT family N-acetyltransferase n=1 Tax=Aquimarina sp. Aq107 TaxID=1191912 RepID=UPI000D5509EF|nr:GNAT family N-acetyltransferase [Aquimarina sp. Aq107]